MKIISGGQTGVDIAAIDFAIENSISWGGTIPKNRRNDNGNGGIIDSYTNFIECDDFNYLTRTELNVKDSDGTLIVLPFDKPMGNGSKKTKDFCIKHKKPFLIVNIKTPEIVLNWVSENNIKILNIAGARERTTPGIYNSTKLFLKKIF